MISPTGSEQVLSLVWALEFAARSSYEEPVEAVCDIFGISHEEWEVVANDVSWFIGDSTKHRHSREQIESLWNHRFEPITNVHLDEDAWHLPLWRLWLKNGKMIFAANLNYLISLGGRGTVIRLAKALGRSRTTASKWGNWQREGRKVRIPPRTALPKILDFFELKATCDLYSEPIFLGRGKLHDELLRAQGRHYLDSLGGTYLQQAVARLQEESAMQAAKRLSLKK